MSQTRYILGSLLALAAAPTFAQGTVTATTTTTPKPATTTPAVPSFQDTIDRDAAYKSALPQYQYDAAKPLEVKYGAEETFTGGRQTKLSYVGAAGERVPALLFLPEGASKAKPVPCLLLLHGLGGSKEQMAPFGRYAAQWGYAAIAIDEWGQGERGNVAATVDSQTGLIRSLTTGITHTVIDSRRALDFLATRPEIDGKRLGLAGASLGAIIGTVTSGVEPRLKATILISGGADWATILKPLAENGRMLSNKKIEIPAGMDWGLVDAFLQYYDPATFAAHIAPRAVLIESGRKDEIVVPAAAEALYETAKSGKGAQVQIDWYENAGHIPSPELLLPVMKQWLAKNL